MEIRPIRDEEVDALELTVRVYVALAATEGGGYVGICEGGSCAPLHQSPRRAASAASVACGE